MDSDIDVTLETVSNSTELDTTSDDVKNDVTVDENISPTVVTDQCVDSDNQPQECSESLAAAIQNQVEYYFSDENLARDKFMMQHINRDKRGYVSLNVIATFNKMKKLTTDIGVIAAALRMSKKLEVNKPGTKVRRVTPAPEKKTDDAFCRTVMALNITDPTSDSVKQQFGLYGPIKRIQVIAKGQAVPAAICKLVRRGVDGTGKADSVIVLVEYESSDNARLACEKLTDASDWRRGLIVTMLSSDKKTSSKASTDSKNKSPITDGVTNTESEVKDDAKTKNPVDAEKQSVDSKESDKKKQKKNKRRSRVYELAQGESPLVSSSGSETEDPEVNDGNKDIQGQKLTPTSGKDFRAGSPRRSTNSPKTGRRITPHSKSPLVDDAGEWRARAGSTGAIDNNSTGVSPWVQRRLKAAQTSSNGVTANSLTDLTAGDNGPVKKTAESVTVLRQPRGPDGSRGFAVRTG